MTWRACSSEMGFLILLQMLLHLWMKSLAFSLGSCLRLHKWFRVGRASVLNMKRSTNILTTLSKSLNSMGLTCSTYHFAAIPSRLRGKQRNKGAVIFTEPGTFCEKHCQMGFWIAGSIKIDEFLGEVLQILVSF